MSSSVAALGRASRCLALAVSVALSATAIALADPESPWGVSISAASSYAPQAWTHDVAAIGARTVRGFHVTGNLSQLQPYRDAKLNVSGILMWTRSRTLSLPVDDLEGFRRYVTTTVTRYKGVVRYWEVWNEPPNFTEDTSPASYAKVVAVAYDAAKAADPNVQIGLAAKSVHLRYLAETIASGARDKFDFITLHPYEVAALIPQGCEPSFLGIVANTRAMLRKLDPARAEVPIWFSEIGVELQHKGPVPIDEATQADTLIKIYTMAIAQGVAQIDWFDPRDSEGRHHGLQRGNGEPRPAYHAYKALVGALGEKPKFLGYLNLSEDSYAFLFAGPRADVVVAWTRSGASRAIALSGPGSVQYPSGAHKPETQTLTLGPAALVFAAPRGSLLASDLRRRTRLDRASWQLDTAMPLNLSASEPRSGICVVNAPKYARTTPSNELNLAGTQGAWFAVDPSFMGFNGGAIEVKLTTKGHGIGNPGFNLKYESTRPLSAADGHGMVGTGTWNFVKGSAPLTFTWQINDASFVGKYGANLAVDCDAPEHCDFSILSLTIRKL